MGNVGSTGVYKIDIPMENDRDQCIPSNNDIRSDKGSLLLSECLIDSKHSNSKVK